MQMTDTMLPLALQESGLPPKHTMASVQTAVPAVTKPTDAPLNVVPAPPPGVPGTPPKRAGDDMESAAKKCVGRLRGRPSLRAR